jgi:hypothetical protein
MITLQKFTLILDVVIDLTLKIVGIYFLCTQEWTSGAMMFLASGTYSISMYFGWRMRKETYER